MRSVDAVGVNCNGGNMRNAAKLIGAASTAAAALAVLATVHDGAVDAAADVALVGSLLGLAHTVFRLVDEPDEGPLDDADERP
jgi:hypothetical protein